MRGIIISPVKIIGQNSLQVSGEINPITLRQYLLYWDKIDLPINNIIGFGDSPEIKFLKNEGVMQQTNIKILEGGEVADLHLKAQLQALEINNQKDKGRWTLGQENIDLVLPKNNFIKSDGIEIDLYRSLPIPTTETSLEDILKFKDKRKDELLEFRYLMDTFYLEIIKSGDSERAMIASVDRIQKKISDIDRVMNESMFSRIKGNLKVNIDLKEVTKNTLLGITGGLHFDYPTSGALLGFAASFINIKAELMLKPKKLPIELQDYAYLYYANDEEHIN